MKNKTIQVIISLVCVFMINNNSTFSQTVGELKIEKKLHKLFNEKGNLKKCNRVAKSYVRNSKPGDEGLNSAFYYTALTYIYYPDWNWTKWRVLHGAPYIMNTEPLNYIDSTLRYNDFFLKDVDKGFITKVRWQEELFNRLNFEITYTWANQLIVHKYPEDSQDPKLIYTNHKEECDSILVWKWKLYKLAKEHYPQESLELFTDYHSYKNAFLGLDFTEGQLDTIYDEFPSYMDLHDNSIGMYRFLLPSLMEIDTSQFYRFLHLIEAADSTFSNSENFNWKETTSGFGYDTKYITIWHPLKKTEDAGSFPVTDSIRKSMAKYSMTFAVPFNYDLYPGDTLKFHSTDNENFVIVNLQDLQQIHGSGMDTIIVQFTDPYAYTFRKQREWKKREEDFVIRTNRGNSSLEFVYRYEYVE